jgi:hypothetical protein
MQHVFEYIIMYNVDEEEKPRMEHELFITDSSRMSKVAKQILKKHNLNINSLTNFQLRKLR